SITPYGTCFNYGGFNQGNPEPLTSALCCANYPFVGIVQACTSSSSCTYTCYCYRAVADVSLGEAPAADCNSCSPAAFTQVSRCGVSGLGMELYSVDWTVSASTSSAAAAASSAALPASVTTTAQAPGATGTENADTSTAAETLGDPAPGSSDSASSGGAASSTASGRTSSAASSGASTGATGSPSPSSSSAPAAATSSTSSGLSAGAIAGIAIGVAAVAAAAAAALAAIGASRRRRRGTAAAGRHNIFSSASFAMSSVSRVPAGEAYGGTSSPTALLPPAPPPAIARVDTDASFRRGNYADYNAHP
ncbi:hypothetical protein HK405_014810, partial [Cladochytrium tenue]